MSSMRSFQLFDNFCVYFLKIVYSLINGKFPTVTAIKFEKRAGSRNNLLRIHQCRLDWLTGK